VNQRGYLLCTRHALPHLIAARGAIVYTSSAAAFIGEPARVAYGMSKAAVNALMRHVASRWGKQACAPTRSRRGSSPPTRTASSCRRLRGARARAGRSERIGEARDVAALVAMLFSARRGVDQRPDDPRRRRSRAELSARRAPAGLPGGVRRGRGSRREHLRGRQDRPSRAIATGARGSRVPTWGGRLLPRASCRSGLESVHPANFSRNSIRYVASLQVDRHWHRSCDPLAHGPQAPRRRARTRRLPARRARALGLAPADAAPLAERLVGLSRDLRESEMRALREGMELGRRAARQRECSPELQRMLEDFAAELQKLDEGLRVLTAFLSRLREQTEISATRTLH
jgi:hypothetical protein